MGETISLQFLKKVYLPATFLWIMICESICIFFVLSNVEYGIEIGKDYKSVE